MLNHAISGSPQVPRWPSGHRFRWDGAKRCQCHSIPLWVGPEPMPASLRKWWHTWHTRSTQNKTYYYSSRPKDRMEVDDPFHTGLVWSCPVPSVWETLSAIHAIWIWVCLAMFHNWVHKGLCRCFGHHLCWTVTVLIHARLVPFRQFTCYLAHHLLLCRTIGRFQGGPSSILAA